MRKAARLCKTHLVTIAVNLSVCVHSFNYCWIIVIIISTVCRLYLHTNLWKLRDFVVYEPTTSLSALNARPHLFFFCTFCVFHAYSKANYWRKTVLTADFSYYSLLSHFHSLTFLLFVPVLIGEKITPTLCVGWCEWSENGIFPLISESVPCAIHPNTLYRKLGRQL